MCDSLIRPGLLSETEIAQLVWDLYGLRVKLLKELDSYDDRNYLLEDTAGTHSTSSTGDGDSCPDSANAQPICYTLKVLNSVDSKEPEQISIQNDVIHFAKMAGYPAPAPIVNLEGAYQKVMVFENKTRGITETLLVRLMEFFPGTTLDKVPLTKALCRQIGHYAGWLNKIYLSLPDNDEKMGNCLVRDWHLAKLPALRPKLEVVENSNMLAVANSVISSFEEDVLKNLHKFTNKGFIHSDINDCNIIVSMSGMDVNKNQESQNGVLNGDEIKPSNSISDSNYHISGIIDFGDVTYSCHLFEVAISICYVLINKDGVPPLAAGGCILSSFLKHIKLTEFELERLKLCVCARLIQSIVMGLYTLKANPDNIYNLAHSRRMWPLVEMIWPMSSQDFLKELYKEME